MKNVILSVASIRSKVLDFERNSTLIIEAIKKANQDGASILVTPEMGLTGYSLGDKILWDDIRDPISNYLNKIAENIPNNMLVYVGAPYIQIGNIFNGLFLLSRNNLESITLKRKLPNYGIFYESRNISEYTSDVPTPANAYVIGSSVCIVRDDNDNDISFSIGAEICEDLWSNKSDIQAMTKASAHIPTHGHGNII